MRRAAYCHYVIDGGEIIGCGSWTAEPIMAGRQAEKARRKAYYDAMYAKDGWLIRFWNWLKGLFGR